MHAAQPDWEKSGNIIRSAQVRDRALHNCWVRLIPWQPIS